MSWITWVWCLDKNNKKNHWAISSIYNINGALVSDQLNIKEAFTDFYSALYQSECRGSEEEIECFFKDIELPTVHKKDSLDIPISENEIQLLNHYLLNEVEMMVIVANYLSASMAL